MFRLLTAVATIAAAGLFASDAHAQVGTWNGVGNPASIDVLEDGSVVGDAVGDPRTVYRGTLNSDGTGELYEIKNGVQQWCVTLRWSIEGGHLVFRMSDGRKWVFESA